MCIRDRFVTPERVAQWSEKIPSFSVTITDGILTETGLSEEPSTLIDDKGFIIFVSKTLTEIPADKQWQQGFFILKDRAIISQTEQVGQKTQVIQYSEVPELKNSHFDKALLSQKILSELTAIKRIASMIVAFVIFFIGIAMAIWYCAWSFFWGWMVCLFYLKHKNSFTYEQAVAFVLSVFFPVILLSILLVIAWVSFPFSMTLLFLLMLWYNHLSFHKETEQQP